ncbi:hypothetical protein DYI37_03210 [Fulvimarina endophytica]|uniref:Uncharacterized protein n=1 Tax=Fulvimarina endophytica TaxID=2293836 RepID=A0A371XBN8_9HYPH|nr:hypothetical protein [Fulvimarina endophytica]RFC66464.1 hypothetical protein DYI37_03210 [Fulvimarina endophytica]
MSKPKGALDALLDGLGIKAIPVYRRRGHAQTHARGTLHEIRNKLGDGHLVTVLRCIRQTKGNRDELWSETIGAVSDVLEQRPRWVARGGDLLDAFDTIELRTLREEAVSLRPWPVRMTLRGFIYRELRQRLDTAIDGDLFGKEAA